MATWLIDKLGDRELADASLEKLKSHKRSDGKLYECMLRWMGREVFDPNAVKPAKKSGSTPGLITTWKIAGPYPGDKSCTKLKDFTNGFAADVKWKTVTQGIEPGRIDIQATIGEHDDCSSFAKTTIISPKAQKVKILLQADDLIGGVLNGQLIEGKSVKLNKGSNDLMLKIVDHKKGWRYTCALTIDGKPVEGLVFKIE